MKIYCIGVKHRNTRDRYVFVRIIFKTKRTLFKSTKSHLWCQVYRG